MKKTLSLPALTTIIAIFILTACSGGSSSSSSATGSGKNENTLYVIVQDSLYGFINKEGEIVIKPQFEKAAQFSDGLAYFEKDGKYGFINETGKVVIQPVYERKKRGMFNFSIEPFGESCFKEGLAVVNKNGALGYIDKKGKEVIPARFQTSHPFCEGFACVRDPKNGSYFINKKGKMQFGQVFAWACDFSDGLASVNLDGKVGYINTSGKMVIPNKYYLGGDFIDGYTMVKADMKGDTWKLIDKKGKVKFEKHGFMFSKGHGDLVAFYKDQKTGFLDLNGNVVIPAKFDFVFGFIGDVAIAKKDSKKDQFGLINKKGEWVVQPIYDGLFPVDEKMIMIFNEDHKMGYINTSGKVIWKPTI